MAKTYVVTACNRGLGLEFARQLAERGDRVIATARDVDAATELRSLPVEVHAVDVADGASVERFAAAIKNEAVDVLINNAGVGVGSTPFDRLDFAEMEAFYAVNTIGPLRVLRALLPPLRAGADKKVINLTSRMGSIEDNTGGAAYSYRASKAALNMVTRSLAIDFGGEGFLCVVVHPGWVVTDMGGSAAPVTVTDSVAGMLHVIDGLQAADNGTFIDFAGTRLPW